MLAGGLALWSGNSTVFRAALVGQVPLVLRGADVFNIDCAIRFNAFLLVDEALRQGVAPEAVLQKVRVQRAFTPYQILDVLHAILANPGSALYVLLAPCKQFFDGDVGHDEAVFLLGKMLGVIAQLRARSVPLLVVESTRYDHPAFARAFQSLRKMADTVRELPTQIKSPRGRHPGVWRQSGTQLQASNNLSTDAQFFAALLDPSNAATLAPQRSAINHALDQSSSLEEYPIAGHSAVASQNQRRLAMAQ